MTRFDPRRLLIWIGLVGCQNVDRSGSTEPQSRHLTAGISHAEIVQPIWDRNCTDGCHPGNESMLSLRTEFAWQSLVNIPAIETPLMDRVEPGEPDHSYLIHKIEDTHLEVGGMGFAMPSATERLTDDELAAIREWIEGGSLP